MATQHTVKSYEQELNLLSRKVTEMGGLVETQITGAIDALVQRDTELADEVIRRDDLVDRLEDEVDQLAIRIRATRQPVAVDLRVIVMALKISNDLERMGDYAVNIAKRSIRLQSQTPMRHERVACDPPSRNESSRTGPRKASKSDAARLPSIQ